MEYSCEECRTTFQAPPSKRRRFCSKECYDIHQQTGESVPCQICGRLFYARPIYLKRGAKYCSHTCGARSRETKQEIECPICKKAFRVIPSKVANGKKSYCSKACANTATSLRMVKKTEYGHGKFLTTDKYWATRRDQKIIREHRCIVEEYLGRPLTKEEVVHHINENKKDNRIDNLYLFPNGSSHSTYHALYKKGEIKKIERSNLRALLSEDIQRRQSTATAQ